MDGKEDKEDKDGKEAEDHPSQGFHTQTIRKRESPLDQLEKRILEEEDDLHPDKVHYLSEDVEDKLNDIYEAIEDCNQRDFQTVVNLRMKELAYAKILVFTYEKPQFKLTKAEAHIAMTYLKFKCYEQAENHLQIALVKNNFSPSFDRRLYSSYLRTALAECMLHTERISSALEELNQAEQLQEEYRQNTGSDCHDLNTRLLIAKCRAQEGEQHEAILHIQKAVERAKVLEGQSSYSHAIALEEQSKIYLRFNKIAPAIETIKQAILSMSLSNYQEADQELIRMNENLAALYQNSGDSQLQFQAMSEKYRLMEAMYGNSDKRCIKEQRMIATFLLKRTQLVQCLDQLQDILQKEQKVFGSSSMEVGKSLKSIAAVHLASKNVKKAETELRKAMKIFQDLGDQKLVREVKLKLANIKEDSAPI